MVYVNPSGTHYRLVDGTLIRSVTYWRQKARRTRRAPRAEVALAGLDGWITSGARAAGMSKAAYIRKQLEDRYREVMG